MIILKKEDLHDQAGMERAFNNYFAYVKQNCDGTFNAMFNARLESCDYENRTVVLAVDTVNWMTNPNDMLHGGISASLLDFTMGLLCRYCSGGYMTPTVTMNVSYLRPGPIHKTVYIKAEVIHLGASVCNATGCLWAEGAPEKLIATSTGTYYVSARSGVK